jgi:hypothetical protein
MNDPNSHITNNADYLFDCAINTEIFAKYTLYNVDGDNYVYLIDIHTVVNGTCIHFGSVFEMFEYPLTDVLFNAYIREFQLP